MNKILSALLLLTTLISCSDKTISYFDQKIPSTNPEVFAPSIVNTDDIELNVVFNNNHSEMFFSRIVDSSFVIHHSELSEGKWSAIEPIQMYDDSVFISVACDPTITTDGKTMYFLGVDPLNYKNDVTRELLYRIPPDIYKSEKVNGEWSRATKVDFGISTEHFETYPVVTADGSLYFRSYRPSNKGGMNTYRAQYLGDGVFDTPVIVNTVWDTKELIAYVSPDEQYAICNGGGRFQISYKDKGQWTKPAEIALEYEKGWTYYCPYMSSDGKYFIYSRKYTQAGKKGWAAVEKGEVYWVDASVLFSNGKE